MLTFNLNDSLKLDVPLSLNFPDHEDGAASPSSLCREEPAETGVTIPMPKSIDKEVKKGSKRREEQMRTASSRERAEDERRGTPDTERALADLANVTASSHSERKREREKPTQSSTKKASRGTEGEEEGVQRKERKERDKERGREKRRDLGGRRSSGKGGERQDGQQSEATIRKLGDEKKERKKSEKREDLNLDLVEDAEELAVAKQRKPFSFLMPLDDGNLSDAESALSFSEISISAASISFVGTQWPFDSGDSQEVPATPNLSPGPWLVPSPRKLSQVLDSNRLSQCKGGLWF